MGPRFVAWLFAVLLWAPLSARQPDGLTVTAAGDVRITAAMVRNNAAQLRRLRLRGDLVFANFEGAIGDPVPSDPFKFAVPRESAGILRKMGINAVSLANNHSLDLGEAASLETAAALRGAGILIAGSDAPVPVRLIAYSFSSPRNNVNHPDAVPAAFPKAPGEIVIVSAHMGGEDHLGNWIFGGMDYFGDEPRGDVIAFSHRAIDAGADLVLGHGPHVPRGLELYKGKLIVYSLGNFAFDYPGAALHPHAPGYSISIRLDRNGNFNTARIDSYDLRYGVPVPDKRAAAYRVIRDLTWRNLKQTALSFPGNGRVEKTHEE